MSRDPSSVVIPRGVITTQVPAAKNITFGAFTRPKVFPSLARMEIEAHTRPIHTVRWRNFRALLAARNLTITAAAELLDKAQGQVSNFGGKRPTKVIGDQIAEEIETAFGVNPGSLDLTSLGDEPVKNGEQNLRLASQFGVEIAPTLARAELWVRFEEEAAKRAGRPPWGTDPVSQPVKRAERLIALTQLLQADGGELSPEHAAEIVDAARQGAAPDGRAAQRGDH